MPQVSVVIPVKNGMQTLTKCLDGILSQTIPVKEIIVIDSGSQDGTIDLLKKYEKVLIFEIPPTEFSHGQTRNMGVQHASGEFVVFTVQDAWPADNLWLENLMKGFDEHNVVAVCGQQVVPHHADKNPVQWHRSYTTPKIITYTFTNDAYNSLSPAQKQSICGWDDVTAIYRRNILLSLPFRNTPFAEDAWWANDALLAGYTIAYNNNAKVYHYHHEDGDTAYRRNISEMYSMYKIFGSMPNVSVWDGSYYMRLLKLLYKAEGISLPDKIKWFSYNLNLVRAAAKASSTFYKALSGGEKGLDDMYIAHCGKR